MGWDEAVLEAIDSHRTAWMSALAQGLMDAGRLRESYLAAFVLALVFAAVFRAWRPVAAACLGTVVATTIAEYGKDVIGRPRPPAELAMVPTDGPAMPSSIAALTAGAAVPLILYGLRRADVVGRVVVAGLGTSCVLVGMAMVYLGAHWVSDVLAGWAVGAVFGVAASALVHAIRVPRRQPG